MEERGIEMSLLAIPEEDETFLGRAAIRKGISLKTWKKEELR